MNDRANKLKSIKIAQSWLDDLIPEDIKIPSTTVVTGPAGTAKEILGSMIAASWLNQGGSLIHILMNFKRDHAEKLLSYYDVNVDKLSNKVVYINFDPQIKTIKQINENEFQANILNPVTFNTILNKAKNILQKPDSKILNYMTALNMLLYSNSYSKDILTKFYAMINNKLINLFTFSDNVFGDEMNYIKEKAQNVFYVHGTGIMHLSLKIMKINRNIISTNEIEMPINEELINQHLLEIQKFRQELIPIIKRI